jgi:hypothetical protein
LASLACQTITGVGDKIEGAQSTVQSAVTQVQGMATQAVGMATEVVGIATEAAPLLETAQAVATDNPGMIETAEAVATQGFQPGAGPENVPLVDQSTIFNYFGTSEMATYATSLDFSSVVEFYRTNMPQYGWTQDATLSYETADTVMLYYKGDGNVAIVTITLNAADNSTLVSIIIQPQ